MKNGKITLLILLLLIVFFQTATQVPGMEINKDQEENKFQKNLPLRSIDLYQEIFRISSTSVLNQSAPFYIANDSAFGPAGYNFPGNGTLGAPYEIENYNITDSSQVLIEIHNTTAFFRISNCLLNGITSDHHGVYLSNVTHGTVVNNDIHYGDRGIYLEDSPNNSLSVNTLYNNTRQGITMFSSPDCVVNSNTVFNNSGSGIFVLDSGNITIFNNTAFENSINAFNDPDQYSSGITISASSDISIYNNTSYDSYDNGIIVDNFSTANVFNNSVYNNNDNGLYIYESEFIAIYNNSIHGNENNGIYLNNSHNNPVEYNEIFGNGDSGSGFGITSNEIRFSIQNGAGGGHGIYLDPSNHNNITHNVVHDNAGSGVFLEDSEYNLIDNNEIFGNGDSGSGFGITSNEIRFSIQNGAGGGHGIYLDPSNHNIITNNVVYDNAGNGVFLENSDDNLVENNEIFGNGYNGAGFVITSNEIRFSIQIGAGGGHGIYLDPSNRNEIYNNNVYNNSWYGISINTSSESNTVECNNFYQNNRDGESQAYDNGQGNQFAYNFWDDHDNTDENEDGIADNPYTIEGGRDNEDATPMAALIQSDTRCPPPEKTTEITTEKSTEPSTETTAAPGLTVVIAMSSLAMTIITVRVKKNARKS